jgi:hypothetical protein
MHTYIHTDRSTNIYRVRPDEGEKTSEEEEAEEGEEETCEEGSSPAGSGVGRPWTRAW